MKQAQHFGAKCKTFKMKETVNILVHCVENENLTMTKMIMDSNAKDSVIIYFIYYDHFYIKKYHQVITASSSQ